MNNYLLRKLFYKIFSFKFKDKEIAVCRDKQTHEPAYFFANDGTYSFLDYETQEKIRELVERPRSNILYSVAEMQKQKISYYNGENISEKEIDFVVYTNKNYEFKYLDENGKECSVLFPFTLKVEKEAGEYITKELYSYALSDITTQIQKFLDCGINIQEIVEKFKDSPLTIIVYDFKKVDEKITANGYVYTDNYSCLYLNSKARENNQRTEVGPYYDLLCSQNNGIRSTFKHEFSHSISGASGYKTGIRNEVILTGLNEALTDIAAKDLDDYSGIFNSGYGFYSKVVLLSLPNKKKVLNAYVRNDLDKIVELYTDYYHCTKSEVFEFFYKIDYFHHFGDSASFINEDKMQRDINESLISLIYKREIYLNKGEIKDLQVDWEKYNVQDFVISKNFIKRHELTDVFYEDVLSKKVIPDILTLGKTEGDKVEYGNMIFKKSKLKKLCQNKNTVVEIYDENFNDVVDLYEKIVKRQQEETDIPQQDNLTEQEITMISNLELIDDKLILAKSFGNDTLIRVIAKLVNTKLTKPEEDKILGIIFNQKMLEEILISHNKPELEKDKLQIFEYLKNREDKLEIYNYYYKRENFSYRNYILNLCIKDESLTNLLCHLFTDEFVHINNENLRDFFVSMKNCKDRRKYKIMSAIFNYYVKSILDSEEAQQGLFDLVKNGSDFVFKKVLKYTIESNDLLAYKNLVKDTLIGNKNGCTRFVDGLCDYNKLKNICNLGLNFENINPKYKAHLTKTIKDMVRTKKPTEAFREFFSHDYFSIEKQQKFIHVVPSILVDALANEKTPESEIFKKDLLKVFSGIAKKQYEYKNIYEYMSSSFENKQNTVQEEVQQ